MVLPNLLVVQGGILGVDATSIFGELLRGCCDSGDLSPCRRIIDEMREHGVWDTIRAALSRSDRGLMQQLQPHLEAADDDVV